MDLWVTLTKIKEVVEVKHFCLSGYYYKTQKNRLVKEFGPADPPRFSLILFGLGGMNGSWRPADLLFETSSGRLKSMNNWPHTFPEDFVWALELMCGTSEKG